MKKFYLLALSFVLINVSFSAPIIKSISNGYWNSASTWDLNRLPQVGDSILIPSGTTVTVNIDEVLSGAVYLKIYGNLSFQNNNSTLSLGINSFVWVFTGGQIVGGSASQKLKLNSVVIYQGNQTAVLGPQMASTTSNGFSSMMTVATMSVVLPVKFVGFTLTRKNNDVLIQWSTSEEINAGSYEIERSADGNNWSTISSRTALGNSSVTNNYSYTDKNISATIVYYRVKEVDVDGKTAYTPVKSIKNETGAAPEIKIAAIQNKVVLQIPQEIKGNLIVRFISRNGQIMDQQNINNPVGQVVVNSKFTGNYIISISNGQQINTAKQVIL